MLNAAVSNLIFFFLEIVRCFLRVRRWCVRLLCMCVSNTCGGGGGGGWSSKSTYTSCHGRSWKRRFLPPTLELSVEKEGCWVRSERGFDLLANFTSYVVYCTYVDGEDSKALYVRTRRKRRKRAAQGGGSVLWTNWHSLAPDWNLGLENWVKVKWEIMARISPQ